MFVWKNAWISLFLLLSLAGGSTGCGIIESEDPDWADGCDNISYDQKRSLMAPLDLGDGPIQVWIDPRLNSSQAGDIYRAADVWNKTTGKTLLVARVSTVVGNAVPGHREDCRFASASEGRAFWVIDERSPSVWKNLGLVNHNPAATVRCTQGKELSKQVVVVNPDLVGAQQFMSVMLHELGHAIGLKHSCDEQESGNPRHIGCRQLAPNHPYLNAAMFWKLGVNDNGIRESLSSNDRERAYCHYR